MWRWDQQEPFGVNVPDENPSSLGAFEFPLRFPGQFADKETGLHYNYFRDYDPGVGRYVESDPVGLDGGLNTYSYVATRPLQRIDPRGLAYVSATGGYGQFFGIGGYSSATGIAYGGGLNLCFYSIHCTRFGAGLTVSAANVQVGYGSGTACSGQKWVKGFFATGGVGLGGLSSVRGDDTGQMSLSAGMTVSSGPNISGGTEVCLVTMVCPNEPACCKQPGGCKQSCVNGNLSDVTAP